MSKGLALFHKEYLRTRTFSDLSFALEANMYNYRTAELDGFLFYLAEDVCSYLVYPLDSDEAKWFEARTYFIETCSSTLALYLFYICQREMRHVLGVPYALRASHASGEKSVFLDWDRFSKHLKSVAEYHHATWLGKCAQRVLDDKEFCRKVLVVLFHCIRIGGMRGMSPSDLVDQLLDRNRAGLYISVEQSGGNTEPEFDAAPILHRMEVHELFLILKFLFGSMGWSKSYGGRKWAAIADAGYRFFSGELNMKLFVDCCFNLQHNCGQIFNKSLLYNVDALALANVLQLHSSKQGIVKAAFCEMEGGRIDFTNSVGSFLRAQLRRSFVFDKGPSKVLREMLVSKTNKRFEKQEATKATEEKRNPVRKQESPLESGILNNIYIKALEDNVVEQAPVAEDIPNAPSSVKESDGEKEAA